LEGKIQIVISLDVLKLYKKKLDGVFTVRIFEPEYSYKNLVNHSKSRDKAKTDKYDHTLDLVALNSKLNELNLQEVHKKRHDLEKIYWVTPQKLLLFPL
jgi:hypothetical protein